jgi:hypothetical protein
MFTGGTGQARVQRVGERFPDVIFPFMEKLFPAKPPARSHHVVSIVVGFDH